MPEQPKGVARLASDVYYHAETGVFGHVLRSNWRSGPGRERPMLQTVDMQDTSGYGGTLVVPALTFYAEWTPWLPMPTDVAALEVWLDGA